VWNRRSNEQDFAQLNHKKTGVEFAIMEVYKKIELWKNHKAGMMQGNVLKKAAPSHGTQTHKLEAERNKKKTLILD